ncbi:MAG: response regulator transcription factor [Burkholderiaceae bacterium]|nr:response regulator transcription factor [Burkholderiaceae bacterium]
MKILVADDHALIREGMRMVLRQFDTPVECVDAADGASVQRKLETHPDVELVLLDRRLPDCDGMVLLRQLVETHPALPIVMVSAEYDSDTVSDAIGIGAAGFIPKTSVTTVLIQALRLIIAGGVYVPPEVLGREPRGARVGAPNADGAAQGAADHPQSGNGIPGATNPAQPAERSTRTISAARIALTERQVEVLAQLMRGKSNKQISRELDLAEATVKVHVRSILRALDASSRTEAVVTASRLGLNPDRM